MQISKNKTQFWEAIYDEAKKIFFNLFTIVIWHENLHTISRIFLLIINNFAL